MHGSSYLYNTLQQDLTREPMEDAPEGMAGKKTNWIPIPSLYIVMYEQSAKTWCTSGNADPSFFPVHESNLRAGFPVQVLSKYAGERFVSPILFVDGHVARCDFTRTLKADPCYTLERTKDWMWYKPKPSTDR